MDEINLTDYLRLLVARRKTIIVVTLVCVVITGVALIVWPRTYEGETVLIFPQQAPDSLGSRLSQMADLPLLGGIPSLSGREVYVTVMKSRTISENVLKRLGLDRYDLDSADMQDHLALETPKEGGLIISCQVSTSWLKGHVPQSQLKERTAELAARVANAYVSELTIYDRSNSLFMGRKNRLYIEKQLARCKVELAQTEERLEEFQMWNPTLIPPQDASTYVQQAQGIAQRQVEADVAIRETEGQLARARSIWKVGAPRNVSPEAVVDNPAISELKTQLARLEVRRAILMEDFTEKHPSVVGLSQEIDKIDEALRSEIARVVRGQGPGVSSVQQGLLSQLVALEVARDGIAARQQALSGSWTDIESRLADLPAKETEYVRLLRDRRAAETVYMTLLAEHAKARVAEGRDTDNFIVLDKAIVPKKPAQPRVKRTLVVALVLGVMLGVAMVSARGPMSGRKRMVSGSL